MINDRIKSLIRDYNTWWEGTPIIVPEYKRHIYADVQKYMKTKQIIAIVGLRRVGKTSLMKQIIKENIEKNKENTFYFLFDELLAQNPEVLEDVLDHYLKTIAKEGRKYIFLDEIQKVPYWQDILKRFYDTREDIKFIISGSASLQIKKSKESLAGRIYDFFMPVLTFREFLELNGLKIEKAKIDFRSMKSIYEKNIHKKPLIEELFSKYVFKGAFPELVLEEDEGIIKNYIRNSVIDKIIFEDIPSVFDVKKKDVLSSMLEYCSRETSNLLDVTNLSKILKVNYQTARSYLFYLQSSFMIDIVYNYSKSASKQLRKNKKVHIVHPSITITIMRYSKDILGIDEVMGKYVESIVFEHSKLLSERIFFWRTPQKEEIDIILEAETILPVEVKYRKNVEQSSANTIIKFANKHKIKRGIVVTRDFFDEKEIDNKNILFVPAWLFLLTV
ncbi:MAG: ATP-binding protein [Methanosarcinales archaeon]|nr:MAG: ATP-binding protein [Methanosarcinales archaeon]